MTGDTLSNQRVFHRQRQASSPQQHLGVSWQERPTHFPPEGHLEAYRICVSMLSVMLKNTTGTDPWWENLPQHMEALVPAWTECHCWPHSAVFLEVCTMRSFWRKSTLAIVQCQWHISPGKTHISLSLSLSLTFFNMSVSFCMCLCLSVRLSSKHTHAHTHTHTYTLTVTLHTDTYRTTPRLMHRASLGNQGIHYLSHTVETWT